VKSLKDLGTLKSALEHRRIEQTRQRVELQRHRHEQRLFELAVADVQPLRNRGLAQIVRPRPAPLPQQRALDEQAALREALSDEIDVDTLLDTDEALSFRRPEIGPDVLRRLRRGQWTIQAEVDLHGLTRDDAREQLSEFVRDAVQRGLRCVRVVHGKGHGSPGKTPVLKGKVRGWLVQKHEVVAFTQARAAQGGAGALIVLLKG
jgi:DNA-nicking Smr family endonuclease